MLFLPFLCILMVILVNSRFWNDSRLEGIGNFTKEVCLRLARNHPEHHFIFLFDRKPIIKEELPQNAELAYTGPQARHPLLWAAWFNISLPLEFLKHKADLFLSLDGFGSLTLGKPQCILIHDLGFLHQPSAYKSSHLWFMKKFLPVFIRKARAIATVSEFSSLDIQKKYGVPPSKISVVYNGTKPFFKPVNWEEGDAVREGLTGGSTYFIYVGAIQPRKNLVRLLKGFSLFKKRLKSNMKLVLAGRLAWKNEDFIKQLKTYKYREDVILTGYLDDEKLASYVGASYALVYPSLFEGFGVPVLEGMQAGVPVLTSQNSSMEEIGEDGALYFNAMDPADIGDKLMLIYKDEELRKKLIHRGKEIAKKYSWDRTAELLWNCIEKTSKG